MSTVSRRAFVGKGGAAFAMGSLLQASSLKGGEPSGREMVSEVGAKGPLRYGVERCVVEWAYTSGKVYSDPFNDVELDVVLTDPQGREQRVPTYWAGDQVWRVRYSPSVAGRYTYRAISSDTSNLDLQGQPGILEVSPYTGGNPLRKHGAVHVATDGRHFEHDDGTPFFWLGDTWWMGLCNRLRWPEDFQVLTADRVEKGFTVIQIVAGLGPDGLPFDTREANEAGFPWEPDFVRINPRYFDMADLRIQYLVERGLVPCIFGCWGFYLSLMGVPKMKKHWRYLVARWGAYPVVWCLAGEGAMPFYFSKTQAEDTAAQKRGWTELGRYLRSVDPYHHPVTIHPLGPVPSQPTASARTQVEDPSVLDFDMLQTGHDDRKSIPTTVNEVTGSLLRSPRMPVLVGEVCYEGIMEASRQEVQRFMFWTSILNGAAGHTYGANGIWQVNTEEQPYGLSPYGRCWGDTPWEIAAKLPGSQQQGLGKRLLMRYAWWRFQPHPDWVDPHWSKENYEQAYAAGTPGKVRVIFVPLSDLRMLWNPPTVKNLESDVPYQAYYFNPATGKEHKLGDVVADATGTWQPPVMPSIADWILVLEKKA